MKKETPKIESLIEKAFGVKCDKIDRHFKNTRDKTIWYKVNRAEKTMYTPGLDVLRVNPQELANCMGAAEVFINSELDDPSFDWDHLNLTWLHTEAGIDEFLLDMSSYKGEPKLVAVDIETRDLSWDDNKLLSIGFATSEDTCVALSNIPKNRYSLLEKALNNPNLRYAWHNGKFDCTRLKYICNINARVDEDTMLKHYVQVSEVKNTHGLKQLGPVYLQAPKWDDELDEYKKKWCRDHKVRVSDFKYDMIPTDILIPYMQRDCIATYRLVGALDKVKEPGTDWIYGKLIEASNVFIRLELNGVMLDMTATKKLEKKLRQELAEANEQVADGIAHFWNPVVYAKETGAKFIEDFNLNSPKQLKWMLSKAVGMELASTDAATIDSLMEHADEYPEHTKNLLQGIARTRKASKYLDTYVVAMQRQMCKDGRIRGSYLLHGTETGRLSSKEPNMQNLSKEVKPIFCATPGYKLVQLDYSQAELRVLGMLSGDEFLIQSYKEDKDLHSNVAEKIFGKNFTKEHRRMAKTVNFGIAYGRGASAISEAFHMEKSAAQKIIDDWFNAMPKVREYINNQRRSARRGERQQTLFGRVRHYVINDSNMYHVENEYINTPIQSIASDMTLFSLIEIDKWLREERIDARIVMTVHDSIVLEVKDDPATIRLVAKKCQYIMSTTPQHYVKDCPVPFKADAETGYSYGHMEEIT